MKNIYSVYPASCMKQPWREGFPIGNGLTGAVVYGSVGAETVVFNRFDLWHGAVRCEVPDTSAQLKEMRALAKENKLKEAKNILCDELRKQNYHSRTGTPFPLGALKISFPEKQIFSGYKRVLNPNTAECTVSFTDEGVLTERKCFVSRTEDVFVYSFSCGKRKKQVVTFDMHDDETEDAKQKKARSNPVAEYTGEYIFYDGVNDDGTHFGAAVKVFGAKCNGNSLEICSDKNVIIVKCYSNCEAPDRKAMQKALDAIEPDYGTLLKTHTKAHKKLFDKAEIKLWNGGVNKSNEQLLSEAYQGEISAQLTEKMWSFGRYLMICGSNENSYPFPLYGLWNGEYNPPWAQNVANENVEMIYWHILTGNLCELMKPLIKYYCLKLEDYREYAKKLFGCNGIFVSVYSSPINSQPTPVVPVIIHYISVAGWLSQHFYKYYLMTGDRETAEKYILPFMSEAAEFYEDYCSFDKNGKIEIYPSVSPENTPGNYMEAANHMSHPMPVAKNAVMDMAIYKELLTNLISLNDKLGENPEKVAHYRELLGHFPEYTVNKDGAVKEWNCEELQDNYAHRHLSHIYPVFPGDEVTQGHPLFEAFRRAVDLREIGSQSGWSLMHMGAIYASFGDGEKALECMTLLAKACITPNLFTLHNDFRNMGITMDLGSFAPVQLDANMGFTNLVQLMLFKFNEKTLWFLPALPKKFAKGKVKGFRFYQGTADFEWDTAKAYFSVRLSFLKNGEQELVLPEILKKCKNIYINGEKTDFKNRITLKAQKGETVLIGTEKE